MPWPRKISREAVLSAGLRIADAEGVEAVTMRRVAAELGVEAMSLYKHIPDKAAVLDGISEAVLAEVEVPTQGADPAATIKSVARSIRRTAQAHPRVFPLIALRPVAGPVGLRLVEETLRLLLSAGLDELAALKMYRILDSYTIGAALLDVARMTGSAPLPDFSGYPILESLLPLASPSMRDEAFEQGLDQILGVGLPREKEDE